MAHFARNELFDESRLPRQAIRRHNPRIVKTLGNSMTKLFTMLLLAVSVAIVTPVSAADSKTKNADAGTAPEKTARLVTTDMLVPTECLDYGRTVCAQLQGNASRKLIYGNLCYILKNKTPNTLFVPLRSDYEIEQFLLNADMIKREPCPKD